MLSSSRSLLSLSIKCLFLTNLSLIVIIGSTDEEVLSLESDLASIRRLLSGEYLLSSTEVLS